MAKPTPEELMKMLPSQRAGLLPGIVWESILNGMQFDVGAAKSDVKHDPERALETLENLHKKLAALSRYIMEGKEK